MHLKTVDWRLLVAERIANIGIALYIFGLLAILMIFGVLTCFWIFWVCRTSLLCIMGELTGGGSVPVDVNVSDR